MILSFSNFIHQFVPFIHFSRFQSLVFLWFIIVLILHLLDSNLDWIVFFCYIFIEFYSAILYFFLGFIIVKQFIELIEFFANKDQFRNNLFVIIEINCTYPTTRKKWGCAHHTLKLYGHIVHLSSKYIMCITHT